MICPGTEEWAYEVYSMYFKAWWGAESLKTKRVLEKTSFKKFAGVKMRHIEHKNPAAMVTWPIILKFIVSTMCQLCQNLPFYE